MNHKERQRYHLLKIVAEGTTTVKDAGKVMGISYRHGKRLKKKFTLEGPKALSMGIGAGPHQGQLIVSVVNGSFNCR